MSVADRIAEVDRPALRARLAGRKIAECTRCLAVARTDHERRP